MNDNITDTLTVKQLISAIAFHHRKIGSVEARIKEGDFVIQDSATKSDIDLIGDWDLCFAPGQRVEMSIIYRLRFKMVQSICPKCGQQDTAVGNNIEW